MYLISLQTQELVSWVGLAMDLTVIDLSLGKSCDITKL